MARLTAPPAPVASAMLVAVVSPGCLADDRDVMLAERIAGREELGPLGLEGWPDRLDPAVRLLDLGRHRLGGVQATWYMYSATGIPSLSNGEVFAWHPASGPVAPSAEGQPQRQEITFWVESWSGSARAPPGSSLVRVSGVIWLAPTPEPHRRTGTGWRAGQNPGGA